MGFIIATDDPPYFVEVNRGASEIFGFSKQEILSMSFEKFLELIEKEEDRKIFSEEFKSVFSGKKDHSTIRIKVYDINRGIKYLRILMSKIKYFDLEGVEICFIDITEQLKNDLELQNLREQFLHAQRMESIGKLTAGIAHDFNNMLTAIKGFIQLSLMKISENDPLRTYLEHVKSSEERMEKLVKQLLAFSRKQILDVRVININDLIKSMEELIKRTIGEDILFITDLSPDLKLVEVDSYQIEQVILNIVVNARDAMPQGGRLIIETKNTYLDENYLKTHYGTKVGSYVIIAITDTGVGIPPEIKNKIFDPFFSTKKEKGTGLGLSTVYGIVKQHGGNIWVYSEPSMGTTFKIYLPTVDKSIEQTDFEKKNYEFFRGNETVLVVDDDTIIRKAMLEMLRKLGYKTLEAHDHNTALFLAQFYNKTIDLAIIDVVMPGISGVKIAKKIKDFRPDIKILYMSGYTDNVISHHGILDKEVNFIQKPFSIEALSRKIREVLEEKQ